MSDNTIYFFKPVGRPGPVKVGCSRMPERRILDVAIWCPWRLEIIASAPGSFALERFLHGEFASSRINGEWFDPTPAMLAGIDKVRAGLSIEAAFGAKAVIHKRKRNEPKPERRIVYVRADDEAKAA